jgi:hypothetical protein
MPRRSSPSSAPQHDRASVREQRRRIINKRWRRNKDLYRVDEHGSMVVNINSRKVKRACSPETLQNLAVELGQSGPLLFLNPESVRRLPKELKYTVEKCLGMTALGMGELARNSSSHDKVLDAAVSAHASDRLVTGRSAQKRQWQAESDEQLLSETA